MADSTATLAPSVNPPEPTLYPAEFEAFHVRQFERPLPGEEVEDFKTFSWRVSWHDQQAAAIRSPFFEVGGHQWSVSIRPNRELDTGIVSIVLNHESSELLKGGHICTRVMIAMSSPDDLSLRKSYLDQGTYRFTPERKVFGFPDFANRDKLVKRCVDGEDNSIVTVFLKVLEDPTGFLMYPFHSSLYNSRKETGQVTLCEFDDYTDVGLLHLYYIPEIRDRVYHLRRCAEHSSCAVPPLQTIFYSLEVSAVAVDASARQLFRRLPDDSTFGGAARGDALDFAHNVVMTVDGHSPNSTTTTETLYSRIVAPSDDSTETQQLVGMDIFTLSPLHLHDDVFRAIDKTFMINPSPSDVSTTNTPRAGGKLVAFDFAPVLSFQLRPPRTAGTEAPRVTFPTTLDMNPYLPSSWPPVAKYDAFPRQSRRSNHFRLHTVICQLPDVNIPSIIAEGKRVCNSSYAFIRPSPDGPWFLHRNDRVVPVTEKEVLETAYGGRGVAQTKKYGAAVSLVYVDEEFERTRKVKEPKAGYLIREWVKNNIPLKEGEHPSPDPMLDKAVIVVLAAMGVAAAYLAGKLVMKLRR